MNRTDEQMVELQERMMAAFDGELDAEQLARLERELGAEQQVMSLHQQWSMIGDAVREVSDQRAREAGADQIADWVMQRIEAEDRGKVVPLTRRRVWLGGGAIAAGLAAAAAVAFVVWNGVSSGVRHAESASGNVAEMTASSVAELVTSAVHPTAEGMLASEGDDEKGVQVDAVDFGAASGAVFYVPDDEGTMTAVVWLSDDAIGGSE